MADRDALTIALATIFGIFALVAMFIVAYFLRKYYSRTFAIRAEYSATIEEDSEVDDSDDDSESAFLANLAHSNAYTAYDSYYLYVVESGRRLIQCCKDLTNSCSSAMLQYYIHDDDSHNTVRPLLIHIRDSLDIMTEKLHNSQDCDDILDSAAKLLSSVDVLVNFTLNHVSKSKLSWLPPLSERLLRLFKQLCQYVESLKRVQNQIQTADSET